MMHTHPPMIEDRILCLADGLSFHIHQLCDPISEGAFRVRAQRTHQFSQIVRIPGVVMRAPHKELRTRIIHNELRVGRRPYIGRMPHITDARIPAGVVAADDFRPVG